MKNKTYLIEHPSQLNDLWVIPLLRTKALGKIVLGGSIVNHIEKERWERELNKYYFACGCDIGAKGLIIGFVGSLAYGGINYFQDIWSLSTTVPFILAATFVLSGFGKLFGLVIAQRNLNGVISEIQKNWKVETKPESEVWNCG